MSDMVYNILSKIQRWLPSVGIAYIGLSAVWGLPFGDEINQTINIVATLLGATLEIATTVYLKKMRDKDEEDEEYEYID